MGIRDDALWQRAAAFAAKTHKDAVRKDGKTPYVSHVFRVAMTVRHIFGCDDNDVIAAALLHDTIEDTGTDYDDILEGFGADVANLVALLTKDMRLVEPAREKMYDDQLRQGPWQARLIKLADVHDNLCDAIEGRRPLKKMIEKTRRALDLARGDAELKNACKIVQSLLDAAEK